MDEFVTLDSVSVDDIWTLGIKSSFTKKECIYFLGNCNGYD